MVGLLFCIALDDVVERWYSDERDAIVEADVWDIEDGLLLFSVFEFDVLVLIETLLWFLGFGMVNGDVGFEVVVVFCVMSADATIGSDDAALVDWIVLFWFEDVMPPIELLSVVVDFVLVIFGVCVMML